MDASFGVWITGRPASGKSTLAAALTGALRARGIRPVVLESDVLRRILTPQPRYDEAERDAFYADLASIGAMIVEQGVPVIFDATANRRRHRDGARARIARFLEIHVECPLSVCETRDPKGIYRAARRQEGGSVPGLQVPYEAPEHPEMTVRGDSDAAELSAGRVVSLLEVRGFLAPRPP